MDRSSSSSVSSGPGEEEEAPKSHRDLHQQSPLISFGHELEEEDDSRYHDCIKENDWDMLKKLLKKYKGDYFKKKRMQAREKEEAIEEFNKALQEQKEGAKNDDDDDDDDEELTRFQRIRSYRPFKSKKKEIQPPSERKSVVLAKKVLPQSLKKKMFVDPAEVISPLLMVDSDGMTPLHLACIHKAPETLITALVEAEKKASNLKDNLGRLPLHCAIETWQYDHILERIVKANPSALKTKDIEGRTPLGLAVELAVQGREEDKIQEKPDAPFFWISPTSAEEKEWQFEQETKWAKVNCLQRELMNRGKVLLPSEHGLILDALEAGANPNTIIRFVSITDRYLMMDDELAGTAIGLCVERHYTIETLEYLLENSQDGTTVITDIVQKALKTHYMMGCYPLREGMVPFGKRIIDWSKKLEREKRRKKKEKKKKEKFLMDHGFKKQRSVRFEDEVDGEDDEIENKRKNCEGLKNTAKDWWEVLNHLLFYVAYGRNFKTEVQPKAYHLLHAAFSVPMATPSLIHLMLIVYPEAINEKCPKYNVLPVHIACTKWCYNIIHSDNDTSSMEQVLRLMFLSDPGQLCRRHKGSLPIHLALFGGQSWAYLKPQTSINIKVIGMRDAQSKLFPFQIAALPATFRNTQLLMRCRFGPSEWRELSFLEKKIEHEKVVNEQEKRQLTTIYELLRAYPDAIGNRPVYKESSLISRSLRSLSDLSKHYLSWVYGRNSIGEYKVHYDNLTALRNSIIQEEILPELEQWWFKLKECIWNNSYGEIPKEDDYLLHAALYNSETPPIVTELLIALFPSSTSRPIPGTSTFPLHIAADTSSYQRKQFEVPYGTENLVIVLKSYKEATQLKSNGRLPLHISLARGKSWKEVLPLVTVNPSSLKVKDMQTGLVPFELMASFKLTARENSLWFSNFLEKQMNTFDFYQFSTQERAKALARARKKKELSQLTCIFELIRHMPSVLSKRQSAFRNRRDDDSVTSLYSFGDDDYDLEEESAIFEIILDSDSDAGKSNDLLSLDGSIVRSVRSLGSRDPARRLDSPIERSEEKPVMAHPEEAYSLPQLEEEREVKNEEPQSPAPPVDPGSEGKNEEPQSPAPLVSPRMKAEKDEAVTSHRKPIKKLQRKWMTLAD
eukprot:CAMPEP_0172391258 /NCGR_PEP_ID=MMETSP1061-20121228/7698_1 /TAXON_ID=37318 /ORGANISM="Pseudo-nitzschia pungens, Strain cf. pungens" /LENGTH=1127 /DNA_ID=CAMNT_0013121825 /DNA_START=136 /DNA_END=3519 /DNA_ORIENTATION=-